MGLGKAIVKARLQLRTLPLELFHPNRCIYVAGDLHPNPQRMDFSNHNLGDDLNLPLVAALSGRRVIPIRYSLLGKRRPRHLVIGSILDAWSSPKAIVWGAGLIQPLEASIPAPMAIHAVRGPLTRKELLRYGISCPESFGDPAILMPRIHVPPATPRDGIALIPHLSDQGHPFVAHWRSQGGKVLDLRDYGDWRQFINDLNSCRGVISSSLHGLILADAYSVPSRRIILGAELQGGDFKFHDYYLSFLQEPPAPLRPETIADTAPERVLDLISQTWRPLPPQLPDQLLECCPFRTR